MLQMEFLKLLILNPPKNKKYTLGRLYTRMLNPPKRKKLQLEDCTPECLLSTPAKLTRNYLYV